MGYTRAAQLLRAVAFACGSAYQCLRQSRLPSAKARSC